MNRWIRRVGACVGVGLIVSIAIALCGDARRPGPFPFPPSGQWFYEDDGTIWFTAVYMTPLVTRCVYREYVSFNDPRWTLIADELTPRRELQVQRRDHPDWAHDYRRRGWQVAYGFGWPRRCLSHVWRSPQGMNGMAAWQQREFVGMIKAPESWPLIGGRVTGWLPLWWGLAINTVFYAAVAGLLAVMFVGVTRLRRRRRGSCLACGYDMRGGAGVCPECGGASHA